MIDYQFVGKSALLDLYFLYIILLAMIDYPFSLTSLRFSNCSAVTDYRFVDKHGSELKLDDWDGSDSGWEAVPYVRTIVTRRCANDYSRYRVKRSCHRVPFLEKTGSSRGNDVVCYCETELCNGSPTSRGNCATLCIASAIVHAILSIRLSTVLSPNQDDQSFFR